MNERFPLMGISRLRMMTDGDGVSTLVVAAGCPLRCRMCINPETWNGAVQPSYVTAEELYDRVKTDNLYFIATGGGITFGGGEPLMYAGFIKEFAGIIPAGWKTDIETSLSVPESCVITASECAGHFYVDIKDTDPEIYRAYTGGDVSVAMSNLSVLLDRAGQERVTVRLPLINGFNTEKDRDKSEKLLSDMGVSMFDRFEYKDKGK